MKRILTTSTALAISALLVWNTSGETFHFCNYTSQQQTMGFVTLVNETGWHLIKSTNVVANGEIAMGSWEALAFSPQHPYYPAVEINDNWYAVSSYEQFWQIPLNTLNPQTLAGGSLLLFSEWSMQLDGNSVWEYNFNWLGSLFDGDCGIYTYSAPATPPPVNPTPPIVTITTPANGQVFTNYPTSPISIPVTVSITDTNPNTSIISKHIHDTTASGTTLISSSTNGTIFNPTAGTHTIWADATDGYFLTGYATNVVTVIQDPGPTVTWVSPDACEKFLSGKAIHLKVEAWDDYDSIAQVVFFVDGHAMATNTTWPYIWTWDSPTDGIHTLLAEATTTHNAKTNASVQFTLTQLATWHFINPADAMGKNVDTDNAVYQMPNDTISTAQASLLNGWTTNTIRFRLATDDKAADPGFLGCSCSEDGILTVSKDPKAKDGTVLVIGEVKTNACMFKKFYFEIKNPCAACAARCPIGGVDTGNNCVDIKIALGASAIWGSAGFLQVREVLPSSSLGTPATLHYNFGRPDVQVVRNGDGSPAQVNALSGMITVSTNSSNSYSVYVFESNPSSGGLSNSLSKIITLENVDGDTNHFRVTDSSRGVVADYYWQQNGWNLVTGGDLRQEVRQETSDGDTTTIVDQIKNRDNTTVYQKLEVFRNYPLGHNLITSIEGSGANAKTNGYTYDQDGRLLGADQADGSWERYAYDTQGRPTRHYSPFLNSPSTTNSADCRMTAYDYSTASVANSGDDGTTLSATPRSTIEYIQGQEVSRSFTVLTEGMRKEIRCTAPGASWNDANNLVTITWSITNSQYYGQPSFILHPDGAAEAFSYTPSSTTHWSGGIDSAGTFVSGTREEVDQDLATERTTQRTMTDIASGKVTDRKLYFYDQAGHLTNTVYLDGTQTSQTFDCCHLLSTTDRYGVVTSYGYDALDRQITTLRDGLTISNEFDANGVRAVPKMG
jgi:YD repeat-containing protein